MGDAERLRQARRVRRALVVGGDGVDLTGVDPRSTPGLPKPSDLAKSERKAWAVAELGHLGPMLQDQQRMLYARAEAGVDRRRVLLVLQAMDGGGKDGTVSAVVGALNPLGVRITGFRAPTPVEAAHDFLWRIHLAVPPAGYVGVFNRSHYEDVLAVRVRKLAPKRVWQARYEQINEFERLLAADETTVVKVMLHISADEQRQRLLDRLDDDTKTWKYNPGDVDDRELWPQFQTAYAEALSRCSTEAAPWYVVPADRNWYRNWAVANILLAHLTELKLTYPPRRVDVAAERRRLGADGADGADGPREEHTMNTS